MNELDFSAWRSFFSLTGGSILYCLSAMSVIYGIASMLGPILGHSQALREAYPCLTALNVYEIALLGALLYLVVKEHVTDDAISLVVLIALFLVGTGLTLSTVADQNYRTVFWIGLLCFALAAAKLYSLRSLVGMSIRSASLVGLSIVLAWNFGVGAFLARANELGGAGRTQWMIGWLVLLAGGGFVAVDAIRGWATPPQVGDVAVPFLRRPPMLLIFAAILLTAAGVHQYAVGYIFDVQRNFGDYLPLLTLLMVLTLHLSILVRPAAQGAQVMIALAPLGATLYAILSRSVLSTSSRLVDIPGYPPVLLGLTAIACFAIWWRHQARPLLPVCAAYGVAVILTLGFDPASPLDLNWYTAGGVVASSFLLAGFVRRDLAFCLAGILTAVIGVSTMDGFGQLAQQCNLTRGGALAGMAGMGMMLVSFVFGPGTNRAFCFAATAGVATGFTDAMTRQPSALDAAIVVFLLLLFAGQWIRTRDWHPAALLLVPSAARVWLVFTRLTAWRFVILGFLLLFAGTALRVWKNRRSPAGTEDHDAS